MKKPKKQLKKLKLNTETVRGLSEKNLKEVVGGRPTEGSQPFTYCIDVCA
jgi:natural product precursor